MASTGLLGLAQSCYKPKPEKPKADQPSRAAMIDQQLEQLSADAVVLPATIQSYVTLAREDP